MIHRFFQSVCPHIIFCRNSVVPFCCFYFSSQIFSAGPMPEIRRFFFGFCRSFPWCSPKSSWLEVWAARLAGPLWWRRNWWRLRNKMRDLKVIWTDLNQYFGNLNRQRRKQEIVDGCECLLSDFTTLVVTLHGNLIGRGFPSLDVALTLGFFVADRWSPINPP